jgi:hypothetical protein
LSILSEEDRKIRVEYVRKALQLNLLRDGKQIFELRDKALHRAKQENNTSDAAGAVRQDRRQVLSNLERVRSNFWSMPSRQLKSELEKLASADFPDLRTPIERLQTAANERSRFVSLKDELKLDPAAFESLSRILILPPKDTSAIREYMRYSFARPFHRKQRRQIVETIKTRVPAIYQMEAEWFDSLYKQKATWLPALPVRRKSNQTDQRSSNYHWLLWFLLIILANMFRRFFEQQ